MSTKMREPGKGKTEFQETHLGNVMVQQLEGSCYEDYKLKVVGHPNALWWWKDWYLRYKPPQGYGTKVEMTVTEPPGSPWNSYLVATRNHSAD